MRTGVIDNPSILLATLLSLEFPAKMQDGKLTYCKDALTCSEYIAQIPAVDCQPENEFGHQSSSRASLSVQT